MVARGSIMVALEDLAVSFPMLPMPLPGSFLTYPCKASIVISTACTVDYTLLRTRLNLLGTSDSFDILFTVCKRSFPI